MFRTLTVSLLLMMAGCAANASRPLSQDHPANPSAAASEISQPTALHAVPPSEAPRSDAADVRQNTQPDAHAHHAPPATAPDSKPLFRCPMHPDVTSSDPDAKSPKCGMSRDPATEGAKP